MKLVTYVQFSDEENDTLRRTLDGIGFALGADENERPIVDKWRKRLLEHHERLDAVALEELAEVLTGLANYLGPQTSVQWWREQGAPGHDDAVEGLARARQQQLENIGRAQELIAEAQYRVGAPVATEREVRRDPAYI